MVILMFWIRLHHILPWDTLSPNYPELFKKLKIILLKKNVELNKSKWQFKIQTENLLTEGALSLLSGDLIIHCVHDTIFRSS